MTKSPSRYWLLLGVSALAIAGLLSLVLVVARTPSLSNIPLFNELFHKALVVHVDLSVLVWFLAMACMMWSIFTAGAPSFLPYLEESAQISFGLGALVLTLSPLDSKGEALMSNYIPVITSPVFFLGLSLVMCGVALMLVRVFTARQRQAPEKHLMLDFALLSSAWIALVALVDFVWSFRQMPAMPIGQPYYDTLFWGGGHILQLLHVQIVMVIWLLLARALKPQFSVYEPQLGALFSLGVLSSFCSVFAYTLYQVDDADQRQFFTNMMILAGGISPTILALWILPGLITFRNLRKGEQRALYSALVSSFVLFIYGGILGGMIQGQNVVIPAHYHGSIVGVTLAFMGAAYLWLPKFGYRDVANWKMAYWQPIVYGIGQLMHISGLAWSGGYGVLRKTPGGMDGLSTGVKVAMGFMGLGGLIAIIGGFMFVVVVIKAVRR